MLEKADPLLGESITAEKKISYREQIDAIQFNSLSSYIVREKEKSTFAHRVVSRLEADFFGQPLKRKVWFLGRVLRWALEKARAKLSVGLPPDLPPRTNEQMLRVAVHGTGSLGDFCTHLMFIQEFYRQHGPMQIDFYSHPKKVDDAKFLFARNQIVQNVINVSYLPALKHHYDLIVYLRFLVKYDIMNHERVLQHSPELLNVIGVAENRFAPNTFFFDNHPFLDGMMARSFSWKGMNLADMVGYVGNVSVDRKTIPLFVPDLASSDSLQRYGLAQKRYITIHDGFDTSYVPSGESVTKSWPIHHWNKLVALLNDKLPEVTIIQLGTINSRHINNVALDLRSKTTFDEAAWIIKHSLLHVDGESGLVRLAHSLHTRSVVLFGPTNKTFFGLDNNINVLPAQCGDCWWSTKDWLNRCPRGLATPECMDSIAPERVAQYIEDHFNSLSPASHRAEELALYGCDDSQKRLANVLADLFTTLHLTPVPITQKGQNRDTGVLLDASKQWEYLKAWEIIDAMSAQLGRPLKIADVGGGRGALSPYLAAKGHDVEVFNTDHLWNDGGDREIEYRFQKWAAKIGLKVSYGSLFNVPAESGAYDIVLSVSVLEHVPHKNFAMKEALRLLKPGGKLFLSFDFAVDVKGIEDSLRVEILTPERLQDTLGAVGIGQIAFSREEIMESMVRIQQDAVAGIPKGMTVGSLVVTRLP